MEQIETMTLGKFIAAMQRGWGFWRGVGPQQRGNELATAFADSPLLSQTVTVTYRSNGWGYGPNHYHTYGWEISGLPESTTWPKALGEMREACVCHPDKGHSFTGFWTGYKS